MEKVDVFRRAIMTSSRAKLASLAISVLALAIAVGGWVADPRAMAQQGARDELRIELTSNGFTPNEAQHAPGRFAIAVENSALSNEYTLRLKAEDDTVVSELYVQKGSSAWTVNLPTGTYTLTEAGHPQWTCRIVIQ